MERGENAVEVGGSAPRSDLLERGTWRRPLLARVLAAGLHGAIPAAAAADIRSSFAWPYGARAAVSLAYDDALESPLDHALPALDKLGLKGSFYLTPVPYNHLTLPTSLRV